MINFNNQYLTYEELTHWGWMTQKLTTIYSDNVLSPGQHQDIIWTNAGILLIGHMKKNQWTLNQDWYIFIKKNTFENVIWKMSALLFWPQCVEQQSGTSHKCWPLICAISKHPHVQSSAKITQSNLPQYYIRHCYNSTRNYIRYQNHNRHPLPSWVSYGVSIVRILEKIDHVITTPQCI